MEAFPYLVFPENIAIALEVSKLLGIGRDGDPGLTVLPAEVPHSPQRFAGTVGLVIERKRSPDENDGFMWFCEACGHKLYEEYLHVSDIVTQLPPVFDRFYGNPANLRCKKCGHEMSPRT